MKNFIYLVGLIAILSFIFNAVLIVGGLTLNSVIIASVFAVLLLFAIDKLPRRRSR